MKKLAIVTLFIALVSACGNSSEGTSETVENNQSMYVPEHEKGLLEKATRFFSALPAQAVSEDNPITPEKIALGKTLYMDTQLSKDGNNSCNSCHGLNTFGVDNKQFSEGDLGEMEEGIHPACTMPLCISLNSGMEGQQLSKNKRVCQY